MLEQCLGTCILWLTGIASNFNRSEEEWKKQLILAKRIFQGRDIVEGSFSWWIKSNDSYVEEDNGTKENEKEIY